MVGCSIELGKIGLQVGQRDAAVVLVFFKQVKDGLIWNDLAMLVDAVVGLEPLGKDDSYFEFGVQFGRIKAKYKSKLWWYGLLELRCGCVDVGQGRCIEVSVTIELLVVIASWLHLGIVSQHGHDA